MCPFKLCWKQKKRLQRKTQHRGLAFIFSHVGTWSFLFLCMALSYYLASFHISPEGSISWRAGLLATNCHSFCLSRNVLISLSLKDNFVKYGSLGWHSFSFSTFFWPPQFLMICLLLTYWVFSMWQVTFLLPFSSFPLVCLLTIWLWCFL